MRVQTGVRPEQVRQAAQHTLFVEGQKASGFDPQILSTLLPPAVTVNPLGPSFSIKSVAEAMFPYHPTYYFLVDRDHHDDRTVERSWERFPDPDCSNILIWRRRELENYFIDPEYIGKSAYRTCGMEELCARLCAAAQRRVYLEAANAVLTTVREFAKLKWIDLFDRADDFKTRDDGIRQLIGRPAYADWANRMRGQMSEASLTEQFEATLALLTGGNERLEVGRGQWMHRMRGKKLLPTLVDACFKVTSEHGELIQGKRAIRVVVKGLLALPTDRQPADFQQLHTLISARLAG